MPGRTVTPPGAPGSSVYVGIDLGWTTGATGMAAVDEDGSLLDSGRVRTDDDIAKWIDQLRAQVRVVAVDGPLIVPNETGMRVPEKLIGQAFGAFGASAHTSNRARYAGHEPRAARLATRFGWWINPDVPAPGGLAECVEVYPHPALVGLFRLPYRLDYKKGGDLRRKPGLDTLMNLLESLPGLRAAASPRWAHLRSRVTAPSPGDLSRVEDELDAVVCAHLAWLWAHQRGALHVYGNVDAGYIVATPPPTHRPVQPRSTTRTSAAIARVDRSVTGRPTGPGGQANESRWKACVRDAFAGLSVPATARVEVAVDFVLERDQVGRMEPDLDNLLKSTIDALDGVLGVRAGTGSRVEADDVRIDRLSATKRFADPGEVSGARIVLTELPRP